MRLAFLTTALRSTCADRPGADTVPNAESVRRDRNGLLEEAISMKTVALLLVLATGMVGLAAHGSTASAVPASSAAFAQCFGHGDGTACRPMPVYTLADTPEGHEYGQHTADGGWTFGGDSYAGTDPPGGGEPAPEFWQELARAMVRAGLTFVAAEAVRFFVDRLFGGHRLPIEPDEQVARHAFDPTW
jgi:hypothetical protein